MSREGHLYMMADRYRGAIYTGVTADVARRADQHRNDKGSAFVRKYKLHRLVYIEVHDSIVAAIAR